MKAFEIGAKDTIVFYLHGLRGHAFAQKAALQHMVKNLGVTLISLELPGHGVDSVEQHCMVPPYREIVSSIKQEVALQALDAEQVILMGYSFGAALMMIAAHELNQDPEFSPQVSGLIGVSTAFEVGHNVPRWQLGLSGTIAPLSRYLFSKAPSMSRYVTIREMNIDLISRDPVVQKAIRDDELVYKGRIPLNTSAQVYQASMAAKSVVNELNFPVLLLHSKDDAIARAPRREDFAAHVQLRLFGKLRHNCIDGLMREAVVARRTITQFIVDKL